MSEQVTREIELDAPIGAVWRAIVAGSWLAEEVQLELRPGGEARFQDRVGQKRGWVEEARRPAARTGARHTARLCFWWEAEGEPATRVELALSGPEDGPTLLRVRETRPLDALDLIATPLPGAGQGSYGPILLAA